MKLQSVRIKNFKAIIDSKTVKFGPLTAFIGHNGAGKSSLIEALETYQSIVRDGLDIAMQRWLGIEHARHKSQEAKERAGDLTNPIAFELALGDSPRKTTRLHLAINNDPAVNRMFIASESIEIPAADSIKIAPPFSNPSGNTESLQARRSKLAIAPEDYPVLSKQILDWQFLAMNPDAMGLPVPQQRTGGGVRLAKDGSNIADYLLDIRQLDINAFNGIVETMAFVLPYARDIQPAITSELERKTWLQLTEADFKVPGWMLSTGTLRLLALLALLRHPKPPPLIVVEEIENGLDPRSIHLIVEEIRNAVLEGTTQVILTTHSPYLLDLLTLDHLVLVERDAKGQPCFRRPGNDASLTQWAKDFAPGRLYTMGNLSRIKP